jgi:hypothetical protein
VLGRGLHSMAPRAKVYLLVFWAYVGVWSITTVIKGHLQGQSFLGSLQNVGSLSRCKKDSQDRLWTKQPTGKDFACISLCWFLEFQQDQFQCCSESEAGEGILSSTVLGSTPWKVVSAGCLPCAPENLSQSGFTLPPHSRSADQDQRWPPCCLTSCSKVSFYLTHQELWRREYCAASEAF